jgi:glucokinase
MTGFNGIAAELGHVVIVKDGVKCGCGRNGCFESYASASAIVRMTKEFIAANPNTQLLNYCDNNIENVSGKTIFNAVKMGDKDGEILVDLYEDYLAEGIASLINIFQPEVFIIGGGVSKEGEYLLVPVRKKVSERTYMAKSNLIQQTKIIKAKMGNDAGMLGAAMLGKEFKINA